MGTWANIAGLLTLALALLTGCAVGRQGVVNARVSVKCGAFRAMILGRFVAVDLVNVYNGKYFYRLAIAPA